MTDPNKPVDPAANGTAMEQVFHKIVGMIGASPVQKFVMEAPGRILDEATYAYDASSIFSTVEKPQPVLEAEFRLSDDLYDVADLVGGPNGQKLSLQYLDALNSLLPAVGALKELEGDREHLRGWLLGPVTSSIERTELKIGEDNSPSFSVTTDQFSGNRMGFFQELSQNYLGLKAQWETAKTGLLESAMHSRGKGFNLDEYTRWLANTAPVVEAELAALFADLVVRGYYHEVRTYLGLMDVSSPGEALEDAKARMRDSSMSSLDETETVYPVVMQPVDWFKGLSTDYQPVDLLLDPQFVGSSLVDMQNQLDQLLLQRQQLAAQAPGDPTALQQAVDSAQLDLDTAQSDQVEQFGNATVAAFTAAVKIASSVEDPAGGVLDALASDPKGDATKQSAKDAAVTKVSGAYRSVDPVGAALNTGVDQLTKLATSQNATIAAQQKLLEATRALSDLQASHAAAAAASPLLMALDSQIASLRQRITTLNLVLSSDGAPTTGLPTSSPSAGRWTDIMISAGTSTLDSKSNLTKSASNSSWSVDFLIGSASGNNSAAQSAANTSLQQAAANVQIGLRVTKVVFDRGGWFDPGLFGQTKGMFKFPTAGTVSDGTGAASDSQGNPFTLPAFPVAFVIAKDVTIDITLTAGSQDGYSSYLQSSSATGGGFFCFSANSSTTFGHVEQQDSQNQSVQHFMIRIPGPQIIGWVMEYVAADKSGPYVQLDADFPPVPVDPSPVASPAPTTGTTPTTPATQPTPPVGDVTKAGRAGAGTGNVLSGANGVHS